MRRIALATLLLASGCAHVAVLRPAQKGTVELEAALGGPVFQQAGAAIPLTLTSVGARYGLTERVDVQAHVQSTAALLGILGFEQGLDSPQVVAQTRYHHQYLPDTILEEPGTLSPATKQALAEMGYSITPDTSILVLMHAVDWDRRDNAMHAGSDPRIPVGEGKVVVAP